MPPARLYLCWPLLALLLASWTIAGPTAAAAATTYHVSSPAQLSALPSTLPAGSEVILADGLYAGVNLTLTAAGTATNPVRFRAANPGEARFAGSTQLQFRGSWLVVEGLTFDGERDAGWPRNSSGVIRLAAGSSDMVIRDCRFHRFDQLSQVESAFWIQVYGYRHTIEYCSFEGKLSERPVIAMTPAEDSGAPQGSYPTKDLPRRHRIRYCYFGERTAIGSNGYETIRIGDSSTQMYAMESVVEHCLFERAIYGPDITGYEPEVISNKSRFNLYRYNTFRNNKGGLVLRHGDDCVVEGNFFFGEPGSRMGAGVRVIGLRHLIRNNHFETIDGQGIRAAISVMKGTGEWEEDSTDNTYETASFTRIFHNTVVRCYQPLHLGLTTPSSGTVAPRGVEVRHNLIESDASGGPVLTFNAADGFAADSVLFVGNHAYHPAALYGGTAPSTGINSGVPLDLAWEAQRQFAILPQSSPLLGQATSTAPRTARDVIGQCRPGSGADPGNFQRSGTQFGFNQPLIRENVGPIFSGRAQPIRAPLIQAHPESQDKPAGVSLTLSVTAAGDAPLAYQWYRDGWAIAGATGSILQIAALTTADTADYTVAVSNPGGRAESFAARVTVAGPPTITSQPQALTVELGAPARLAVEALGPGPLLYQWKRNGVELAGATGPELLLPAASEADAGNYQVLIENAYGVATSGLAPLRVVRSFESWIASFNVEESKAGLLDQPAADGISNLMAYALGLDPASAKGALLPQAKLVNALGAPPAAGEQRYLALDSPRFALATGVEMTVQVSGDLVSWTAGPGHTTMLADEPQRLFVRDDQAAESGSQRFIRLEVTFGQ
jgi:poly(beta-D-mannuronate) lyase